MYLKCDALFLVEVLEKFKDNCFKYYALCHSHYLTATGLNWDSMVNMTKVQLDLVSDVDMYLLFEKGMRGGVSYISKRFSKASNKYLTTHYSKKMQSIFYSYSKIIYLVVSCLKFYPTDGFKWINPAKFDLINIVATAQKFTFQKIILNILNDYMNFTMIIILQINWKSKKKCCLIINWNLLLNEIFVSTILKR